MTSPELPFPLAGTTLLTGPSNVGKTRLTARALEQRVADCGARGVVVLDFAPEVERDGTLLGGRLDRFTTVPDAAFHGVLDAHAPRSDGDDEEAALAYAADNAERALALFETAPAAPTAVFVNDATIPFQHPNGDPERLLSYCDAADVAVLNAFDSDELGVENPVSRQERAALDRFAAAVDRRLRLSDERAD